MQYSKQELMNRMLIAQARLQVYEHKYEKLLKIMNIEIINTLTYLHNLGSHFRLEDDEEGFYLSIINRQVYPRIWSDKFQDDSNEIEILAESDEHLLNRTVIAEKDWHERWFGETIEECFNKAKDWVVQLKKINKHDNGTRM